MLDLVVLPMQTGEHNTDEAARTLPSPPDWPELPNSPGVWSTSSSPEYDAMVSSPLGVPSDLEENPQTLSQQVPNGLNHAWPSVVFPFSSQERVEHGLYHVKLEDIRHVMEDQAHQIPQSLHGDALLYRLSSALLPAMRNTAFAPNGEDTIRLSTTWAANFLPTIRASVQVDNDVFSDFIEPWFLWVLAKAGHFFLAGPDCRRPVPFPDYFEETKTRNEMIIALQSIAAKHRGWVADTARTLQF